MSAGFIAMTAVQVVFGTAVPLALASAWARYCRARKVTVHWGSFGLGALVFIASQVVHIPLNGGLDAAFGGLVAGLPDRTRIVTQALILGLSAGVCEEGARFFFFHFSGLRPGRGPGARARDEAMLVGLGHGGIESMIFGTGLVLITIAQLASAERTGIDNLGLDEAGRAAAAAQLQALHDAPWWTPLLGTLERLVVTPFHVSATMLVLYGVVRGRFGFVVLSVLWHTWLNASALIALPTLGPLLTEAVIAASLPVSLGIIAWVYRALPAPLTEQSSEKLVPSGAPLQLTHATKHYDGGLAARPALDRASLLLRPGSRTCLLGVNGAGKTTAMRLLVGALAPSSGGAWLFGKAHDDDGLLAAKRRIGVVPQQPGMYEDLTVREYLELVQALYGRGNVAVIAKKLSLEAHLDRPMARHSGGEQKRIVLAAALLPEPDLLILDEPSAGLDPLAQLESRRLLEEVSRGRTLLLCTHDLDEAEALATDVIILHRGEVMLHAPIDALKTRFPLRLRIRTAQPFEAVSAALVSAGAGDVEAWPEGVRARIEARSDVPRLLRALVAAGIEVEEAIVEAATLSDIFAATVQGTLPPPPAHTDEVVDAQP